MPTDNLAEAAQDISLISLHQADAPVPWGRDASSAFFSRWGTPAPTHWHVFLLWHRVLDNKYYIGPTDDKLRVRSWLPLLLSLFTSGSEGSWPRVEIAFKSFYWLPLTPPVRTIFLAYIQCLCCFQSVVRSSISGTCSVNSFRVLIVMGVPLFSLVIWTVPW